MPFEFTDDHLHSYHALGFTVFRGILPPALLADLRREADKARLIARRVSGPNAQRLQPVARYADELELRPFHDYTNLPALRDALDKVLPFKHWHGLPPEGAGWDSGLGVLLEPADDPWCTAWHRDWRDNVGGVPLAEWEPELPNLRLFNQVNCALYEDTCTWVVPASHTRKDLPAEHARFPTRPVAPPELAGKTAAERERACLEFCRSLPGAARVHLDAGDFMLYRNSTWHLGSYVPYKRRATIHDFMNTPEFAAWMARVQPIAAERRQAGQVYETPVPLGAAVASI